MICLLMGCAPASSKNKAPYPAPLIHKNDLSQLKWWKQMNDPLLNQLIHQALSSNNQILAASANIVQAQAQLKSAYFAWLPSVNVSAKGFSFKGWDTHSTPEGLLAQSPLSSSLNSLQGHVRYVNFAPSYSLNILENLNNAKLATASLERQKAIYMSTRLSIISQTTGSYFTLLGQKQQYTEQKQLIQHLRHLRQLEEVRYKDGGSDYSALADIDQELSNNQASLNAIESSMRQVENALQLLINHEPGPILTHQTLHSIPNTYAIPPHLKAQVLQNRPDIMIAKEELNQADAHLGLSYAAFFPQFSLTGLLGGSSVELVHLLKLTTGLGIVQMAASMPILNGVNYQQIKASKAAIKVAYYNYAQIVRAALVDVDNCLTKQQKSKQAYNNHLKALQASTRAYGIILARYKAGYQDRRSVVQAQIKLTQEHINLTLAKMDYLNSLVEVYQALAGGYQNKSR
jgi:NodT family efflux transporter outer membrane factor (OMF) lipoprotein